MAITLETHVRIPEDVVFRDLDGEAVILNLQSGIYFGLDDVGTRIWDLIAKHGSLGEVLKLMLQEYNVDESTLAKDLLELVEKLREKGLVEIVED